MASVIGFSCTVHPFPVHIVYPLCIECLLEEYRNNNNVLWGNTFNFHTNVFIVLLLQHGCCEHYIHSEQSNRTELYVLATVFLTHQ